MSQQSRRAQCPVCAHSVRVVDGRLADHTRRPWASMFARVSWCPGSGIPLDDTENP